MTFCSLIEWLKCLTYRFLITVSCISLIFLPEFRTSRFPYCSHPQSDELLTAAAITYWSELPDEELDFCPKLLLLKANSDCSYTIFFFKLIFLSFMFSVKIFCLNISSKMNFYVLRILQYSPNIKIHKPFKVTSFLIKYKNCNLLSQ